MGIGSFFGSIFGGAKKVATVTWGVLRAALPILKALRPAVDEVDKAFDWFEQKVLAGGVAADDFLDRNLATVAAVREAFADLRAFADQGEVVTGKLIAYSQAETPDTITEEEALDLAGEFMLLKERIADFRRSNEHAIKALEAVKD